jgi:2-isopropylmalate synthase
VQAITDQRGDELTADELLAAFHEHYLAHAGPYELGPYTHSSGADDRIAATVVFDGTAHDVTGTGNGPIAALVDAFAENFGVSVDVRAYHEHALSAAADATAAAYIEADVDGMLAWGVGLHTSIATASLRALVNAVNRALAQRRALEETALAFD